MEYLKEQLAPIFADIQENLGFLLVVAGGLIVSILSSERHTLLGTLSRIAAGVFCAVLFTDPVLHYLSLEADAYRKATAGIFSMSGYAITRFAANWDRQTVIDFVRALRGVK